MSDAQVIVVGAGPVGLTAACLLADAGLAVTVVEAADGPGDLPRAISLIGESYRTMASVGIADVLLAESNTDTGSRYFGRRGQLLAAARPVRSQSGYPAKSQFDQPVMESELFEAARRRDSVTVLTGTRVTGLSQTGTAVTITVDGPDGQAELQAPWLVGCDGGRSFVRGALGVELIGSTQVERWIVIDLLGETAHYEKFADFHCDGARPHVIVPGIKGRLRIEFMLFEEEDAEEMVTPARIRELVAPFRPELSDADIRRATVYVAHQRVAQRYRVGRVFLAGDAAHLMPPFAGQGLNAGLRDAANIAWKLADVIQGRCTQAVLDTYHDERQPNAVEMVRISVRIGAVVMATGRARTRVRDLAARALRLVPPVRAWLAGMKFIKPPSYLDGLAAEPGGSVDPRLAALVGQALPNPLVVDHCGRTTLLDDALGRGWALLTIGARTPVATDAAWNVLEPTSLAVLSANQDPTEGAVSDSQGYLAEPSPQQPHVLLVRPDRYVAAVFVTGLDATALRHLRRYLAG